MRGRECNGDLDGVFVVGPYDKNSTSLPFVIRNSYITIYEKEETYLTSIIEWHEGLEFQSSQVEQRRAAHRKEQKWRKVRKG